MTPIGVVVLTYNRAAALGVTLERLRALSDPVRLLVVDNASTDGTPEVLRRRFPEVDVLRLEDNAGAAGRNAGLARLETPYVAFCDDDAWWTPGALVHGAALLDASPRLGLVCGRVLVGPGQREDPVSAQMAASPLPSPPGVPGVPILGFLCAASIARRDAVLAAGGFEPRYGLGGEEELLALDLATAGWALAYVAEMVVHHHPSPRRDSRRRDHHQLRNALWTAWLRRRLPDAWRRSRAVLARTSSRREQAAATAAALRSLAWVRARRRVVPLHIEEGLRRLEGYADRRRRRRAADSGGASGAASGVASGSSSRLAR